MTLSKLSLEQLQQRLEELGAEWHAVEAAIAAKKEAGKKELAKEVRQKIVDAGHDVAEIVGLLKGRKRRTTASKSYTTYVDPDNPGNTYVRGPLPAWLKAKMADAGVDLPRTLQAQDALPRRGRVDRRRAGAGAEIRADLPRAHLPQRRGLRGPQPARDAAVHDQRG